MSEKIMKFNNGSELYYDDEKVLEIFSKPVNVMNFVFKEGKACKVSEFISIEDDLLMKEIREGKILNDLELSNEDI